MLEPQTLKFLKALKKNNNKPWFDAHRAQYEAARIDFSNFIQLLIDDLQRHDTTVTGLTSRDCIFRINRDIRFSKDKTPYKTHFGAIIKKDGRKSGNAGYYFHCEPGNSFTGGGLWMPEAGPLKQVRQEIDYNSNEFLSIIREKNFRKLFGDIYQGNDVRLSSMPKGYAKDNELADYLRLKCFIAETALEDEALTISSLHRKTIKAFTTLMPLIQFLNRSLD
jgi:uncharacterized protein (TIGR02453 family)